MPDDSVYLIAIVEHARLVIQRMSTLTRQEFDRDVWIQFALARVLQIIGEAARHVSEPTRLRYGSLPWQQIGGMRHILVHEYFRVDPETIWLTPTQSMGEIEHALEADIGPLIDNKNPKQDYS